MGTAPRDELRFTDVLTTASAVANYLGESRVTADHVLKALSVLAGNSRMEELGRPVSPLVPRHPPGVDAGVDPAVQELVQRWFAALGSDVESVLTPEKVETLRAELEAVARNQ